MNPFQFLALIIGWGLAIALGVLWLLILYLIVISRINLQRLISEPNGDASMSRFQFLIFTFVIAMSLFLITISHDPPAFPAVPPEVLALLGISSGSYVIAKGIQSRRDIGLKHEESVAASSGDRKRTPTGENGEKPTQ